MRKVYLLVIISLFLLYGISNYFWLMQNKLPVSYDEGIHLWTSLRFVRAFTHPAHNIFYELFHAGLTHWPPLFHFIASLVNLIFGTSYTTSVMTNMLFFLLLLISVYLIGKKVYSSFVGVLACGIISLYPMVYGHSRLFQLDFPLTAIVAFSVYCLISTERFKNLKWSIIFGISIGLGMLLKWSYVFFMLPLFLYEVLRFVILDIKNKDFFYRIRNLLIVIILSVLISSIWYLTYVEQAVVALRHLEDVLTIKHYFNQPLKEITWFISTFIHHMLSFLFFTIFIVSLLVIYIRKLTRFNLFITIWYLAPIVLLSYITWKQPRFFMPILPCFAIVSAIGLDSIKNKGIKNFLIVSIFTIAIIQFFNISFNQNIERKIYFFSNGLKNFSLSYKVPYDNVYSIIGARPPLKTDWKHEFIARSITRHTQESRGYPFTTAIIYQKKDIGLYSLFGNYVMQYFLIKELVKSDTTPINSFLSEELVMSLDRCEEFVNSIADIQYILYISKDNTWPTLDDIENFLGNKLKDDPRLIKLINSQGRFSLIDKVELPQGYYAHLYLYKIPEIKKGDLLIRIFNGKIKIFYKEKEMTEHKGLVFKFDYGGERWYQYQDAIWNYIISPYQIKMVCKWPDLDIMQSVLIETLPARKNTINIKVKLESQKDIILERWIANNFISNKYKEWIRPFSNGTFKERSMFSTHDDYELQDLEYNGIDIIGIKQNARMGLPAILFRGLDTGVLTNARLFNPPYDYNSRCITVQTTNPELRLEAGKPKDILDLNISIMNDSQLQEIIDEIERELH